ncbi:MAG: ABC transporter ATP-binding protein [Lentisphaeria bacterium]|nr:ABC transporter ATP-binding protein [Lentisphaeria bacterium]
MSKPIIKVEDISKCYIIGHEEQQGCSRYKKLSDVLMSSFQKKKSSGKKEEFWALKDINFEVEQGDRVGIIGRNGAGKSTLLKVLSKITTPTTGRISIGGRIASLLEVGTGFHPELTGRENIYLNGAILGMKHAEIRKKFDEIVDFSGVEKFLDTPVKRYSSGMYVRLAFAVAAHLEPEILVVDEVLAVGDAEFQKKCLGKMDEISKSQGRTILFVSHNMGAIKQLCNKGILLQQGKIALDSEIDPILKEYQKSISSARQITNYSFRTGNQKIRVERIYLENQEQTIEEGTPLCLCIDYTSQLQQAEARIVIGFYNYATGCVMFLDSMAHRNDIPPLTSFGTIKLRLTNDFALCEGSYYVNIMLFVKQDVADHISHAFSFDIIHGDIYHSKKSPINKALCVVEHAWELYSK